MTIFSRNDKAPEPITVVKTPARPTGDLHVTDSVEPRRLQATAQPISPIAPPHTSAASTVSVISKALKITGQLESSEDIHVEGQVDGDIRAASVKVGNNARVKGTVYGDEVEVSGTVDGKIEASKVVLTRTAHVSGDVIHQDIRIESGAFIDGHCRPEFGKTVSKPVASVPKYVAPLRDQLSPTKNGDAQAKI